jgi:hypothetical protein
MSAAGLIVERYVEADRVRGDEVICDAMDLDV